MGEKGNTMQSAKRAGWEMVGWSVCLVLTLAVTHFTKIAVSGVVVLGIRPLAIAMDVMSAPLWIALAITTFYAVWGLQCGYKQSAWDDYAQNSQRSDRAMLRKILDSQNAEYPKWLSPKEN
jgi:hypothetical protein